MLVYKLTNQKLTTHDGCAWVIGEWHSTDGHGNLCGPGWLHAYTDPLLAVLLNPMHAAFVAPRLFEAEADGDIRLAHGLQIGATKMRLTAEMPLPVVTTQQRVRFGILCARHACSDPAWNRWADQWLSVSVEDQTAKAAWAARAARAAREVAIGQQCDLIAIARQATGSCSQT